MVEIISYESRYHDNYRHISLEWLHEYDLYEDVDGEMLDYPEREILDKDGFIFLAKFSEQIVGTVILIPLVGSTYEILKLGVSKSHQCRGIGMSLLEHSIEQAKRLKAEKIIIESNAKLSAAIRLYTKLGFQEIPLQSSKYQSADIAMELLIKP